VIEMRQETRDLVSDALPTIPAVGGVILGFTFSEWAAILTCVYVIIQIFLSLPKIRHTLSNFFTRRRAKKIRKRNGLPPDNPTL
jgi:hypothetical protein